MKKEMFSERFGLTQAVINKTKNITRRIAKDVCQSMVTHVSELHNIEVGRDGFTITYSTGVRQHVFPAFQIGEEVAVAQSYHDISEGMTHNDYLSKDYNAFLAYGPKMRDEFAWDNKMYVRADLMPHRIRITNIRFERLRDISDEDCMREGIIKFTCNLHEYRGVCYSFQGDNEKMGTFKTAREAFAALINKICGKGTWRSNPWVFVYEFELIS